MKRPTFKAHPDCLGCGLGAHAQSPGLPTRVWDGGYGKPRRHKALLIVGSHPGIYEDEKGESFVGPTGKLTNELYIHGVRLDKYADCYLTNAVRCAPGHRDSVGKSHLSACGGYLVADVEELALHYDEVVLLCTGEKATLAIVGSKQSLRGFDQGQTITMGTVEVRVFATYLAAMLLPGRDPSKILAIQEHLLFLWRYLRDGEISTKVVIPKNLVGPKVPDPHASVGVIALDTETYGCCAGYPRQTCFHPAKSMHWDKVPRRDLVLTVGLSWRDKQGKLRSKVYRMRQPGEAYRLLTALSNVETLQITGSNLPFDVMYLREFDPRFKEVLTQKRCALRELAVINFLENDQRAERGLKTLALILNVTNYQGDPIQLKLGQRYRTPNDPRLIRYQTKDSLASLLTYETLVAHIVDRFGDDTDKWSEFSQSWFDDLVWLAITMQENGIHYNRASLWKVHHRYVKASEFVLGRAKKRWGLVLGGKGSGKAATDLFDEVVESWAPDPDINPYAHQSYMRRLSQTKKGAWSTGKENLNFLLGHVTPGHEDRGKLLSLRRWRRFTKILSTYTSVLLARTINRNKSYEGALVYSTAHPRWYPVPSYSEDSDSAGGTQQGRITSKDPATQTQPPAIEDCQCSRFTGGCIVRIDESQLELRVAAMWSGDPEFMRIFQTDINVHAATASLIKGAPVTKKSDPAYYHAGKTLNFLTLFSGGVSLFQETILREVGLFLPISKCKAIIQRFDTKHAGFREWQASLVAQAKTDGYIELPCTGISRTFLGDIDATYVPTIANFPVQSIAAQLTESAQFAVERWLREERLRTLTVGNTYDEGIYDVAPGELDRVCEQLALSYRRPPLYGPLVDAGLHEVPLDVEIKGVYNDGRAFIWENGRANFADS